MLIAAHPGAAALADTPAKDDAQKKTNVQARTAGAQPAGAELKAISVSAPKDAADDSAIATVGKMPLALREIPQSVSVTTRERMEQQNLFSLDEVMQQSAGVTVQPYVLLTTAYFVRGFKVDSFELDGVPVVLGDMASAPQDMSVYERVEILRGANGLLHGAGNPAATVNLVRKRPQYQFAASAAASVGSWGRYRAEADIGGPLNPTGTVRGRLVAAYENRHFFYDRAKQNTRSIYGITEIDVTRDTLLTLGAQYQSVASVPDMSGVPMARDGASLGLPRSTFLDVGWGHFDWDTTRAFGSVEQKLGGGWKAKLSGEYQAVRSDLKYAGSFGAIDPATGAGGMLTGGAYQFSSYSRSVDANVQGPVRAFGLTHELLLGMTYANSSSGQLSAPLLAGPGTPVNVYRWNPDSVPEPGIGPYRQSQQNDISQKGIYGLSRIKLAQPVTLVLGGRVSWWSQDSLGAHYNTGRQFTPYGGLIWDFARDWSWYASYAEVFQPQTKPTWGGGILTPVKGRTYETGIKGELAGGKLNVSLAAFRIDLDNSPQVDAAHPCAGQNCYYVNGGSVRSQGFEFEANGRITPWWSVWASYTFDTMRYAQNLDSSQFAPLLNPRHLFRLWTHYDLPWQERRWSIGGGVQVQSDFSAVSNGVTMRQGGYALASVRLGYRHDRHWSAALNVNNLFDRTYYQSLSQLGWNNRYGEPRNVMLTVRGQF
ncbi:TonB-dependent siderophore receptor [Burkholderia oklahomensis]|uniref:Fe(3+)-pyochelin receptor n=1 Tax=Burkholderia oklahomensis TaxID=342113 RepID=A0AAI8FQ74_9BURK|nr:TonB-dependent siderophore receptor [Burkholderia oklahomensis]AIO69391.1 fe(3+)-pyochelin receptor [Burkholderia oklahomensis]AJX34130.1 fe(3+)-pyochelin receptor [Burkholderia oklahomensis C6786]AOI39819.1 amino acid ABC transporter substrate-binding protein [Burkholderia oklahomensis EO147]AOI49504.1 amino acid ABC transporter substrate-binding protein [Burkholderia oklahomensis C6786]KUY62215.1 amino acid ABC transporter substrate-binding protein [Burkholderia oklahomensis C6786]